MSTITPASSQGEVKRRIAELVGTDCARYSEDLGVERHRRLTSADIDGICDEIGLDFLDCTKQEKRDAIMLKLGRDHRTGKRAWDSSDFRAVVQRLEEVADGGEGE